MSFLRLIQYRIKMSLVAIWCAIATIVFYLATFPFNHHKSLSWAFAKMLNFGVRIALRIRVSVLGRENMIPAPAVIIMNHQSNFDPLLQGPVFPKNTVIIAKKELRNIPLWGRLLDATNNISPLPNLYLNEPFNDEVFVRMVNNANNECLIIDSFLINIGLTPPINNVGLFQ